MVRKISVSILLLGLFAFMTPVFAESGSSDESSSTSADENTDATGESPENDAEDVETKIYTIYVHADCPHCQRVERFVAENGIEANIKYLELKNNEENYQSLSALWEANNVAEGDQGWPFMIVSEEPFRYAIGDAPIIQILEEEFNIEDDKSANSGTSGGSNLLFAIGGLVLLSVLGYGIYALMGSSEN